MVQPRSTFWFGLQLVTQTKTQINVQGPYPGQTPLASTQSSVRSGQTWRSTSRPQLRSKFNLIPGKSIFLAPCSSGMVTRQSSAALLYSHYPPDTSHSRHRKIKTCIFLSKPFPFLLLQSVWVSGVSPADWNPLSLRLYFL